MNNNYKSLTKDMTNEQILDRIEFHGKYLDLDLEDAQPTSHLAKLTHYEGVAKKRKIVK